MEMWTCGKTIIGHKHCLSAFTIAYIHTGISMGKRKRVQGVRADLNSDFIEDVDLNDDGVNGYVNTIVNSGMNDDMNDRDDDDVPGGLCYMKEL